MKTISLKITKNIFHILAVALIVLSTSCGENKETTLEVATHELVGKWKSQNPVTFGLNQNVKNTYEDHIILEFTTEKIVISPTETHSYTVSGDTMSVTDNKGRVRTNTYNISDNKLYLTNFSDSLIIDSLVLVFHKL